MSLDADNLVDRRRLRRKVTRWRVIAIVAIIGALLFAATNIQGAGNFLPREQVARVTIDGFISDDHDQQALLEKIAEDNNVQALILHINSPGGTTTGSEALYEALRKVAAEKPIVAVMGTIATSGGYIAALGADHIIARGNTITGSIGVIFQWTQVTTLLTQLGIEFEEVKSSILKAEPSPFSETPPEARAVMEAMVADSYDWFLALVAERRNVDQARARILGDGRVYTGRQALEVGLIDGIGGEDAALRWLHEEHNIDEDIRVSDWKSGEDLGFGLFSSGVRLAGAVANGGIFRTLSDLLSQAANSNGRLDGLVSVWQAPETGSD
ncbi:MAG: signal peptide peptidase SppA [Rhizobiales bacterium]|nr:signal peptide peptidase SppA [Hyphomicrobiales bacterium]